jgi:hypothetical protein
LNSYTLQYALRLNIKALGSVAPADATLKTISSMAAFMLRHTLLLVSLLLARSEVAKQDAWDMSNTRFNFTWELTQGASSSIIVPGNHSIAGEVVDPAPPAQLTR